MDEREENLRDAMKDEDAFPAPPRSRFNPDEATSRDLIAAANTTTVELQGRIVQARHYVRAKGGDPQLEAILAGQENLQPESQENPSLLLNAQEPS